MVDRTNLSEVNDLYSELEVIEQGFKNLDAGGSILNVTLGGGPMDVMPYNPAVTIPTTYMTYPPQMLDAIRSMMAVRRTELERRLEELGLTGIGN